MTRRRGSRGLPALLSGLLLVGFGVLPHVALCIAGGGHFDIEILDAGCCHPEEAPGAHAAEGGHCPKTCRDTPLGSGPLLRKADPDDPGFDRISPAALSGPLLVILRSPPSRLVREADLAVSPIPQIRTVVLLC